MSHPSLPKEQQSAYQRWEMASLDAPAAPAATATAAMPAAAAPSPAQLLRQQAEQLALLQQQAHEEGHAAGFAQGLAEGTAAGRAAAEQERAALLALAAGFSEEVGHANELIAADLLHLGLDIARAVLKTALEVRPELVLPVVSEAIRYLPTVQKPARLTLHPLDAPLVQERLGHELASAGWTVATDAQLLRGGCRVDTPSHHIDATLEGRWQRVAAALGMQSDWLAP